MSDNEEYYNEEENYYQEPEEEENYYQEPEEESYDEPEQQCDQNTENCDAAFNFGSIKDALAGFGSGKMSDIVGEIKSLAGGDGNLSNIMSSGGLESIASGLIANAAHRFFGINPETGRIIGAIAGNIIFNLSGKHNSLGDIGKLVLENILSGKFKRKIKPFVSPTPGIKSFHLDFYRERDRCLRERVLFEDPEFSAHNSSLYYSKAPKYDIEWKRPAVRLNFLCYKHAHFRK
jgi:calpain